MNNNYIDPYPVTHIQHLFDEDMNNRFPLETFSYSTFVPASYFGLSSQIFLNQVLRKEDKIINSFKLFNSKITEFRIEDDREYHMFQTKFYSTLFFFFIFMIMIIIFFFFERLKSLQALFQNHDHKVKFSSR